MRAMMTWSLCFGSSVAVLAGPPLNVRLERVVPGEPYRRSGSDRPPTIPVDRGRSIAYSQSPGIENPDQVLGVAAKWTEARAASPTARGPDRRIFTVDFAGDAGDNNLSDNLCKTSNNQCTLRAAIQQANASPGSDTIYFAIGTGVQTIQPRSTFPDITDTVIIDGTSQPGYAGTPLIQLDGQFTPAGTNGFLLEAQGCEVRGLAIYKFLTDAQEYNGFGIALGYSSGNCVVEGNYIGTNASGTQSGLGTTTAIGIWSAGNRIGGATAAARNVLSGNHYRAMFIYGFFASNNIIQGNYMGTTADGNGCLPNTKHGIEILDASSNTVGGTNANDRNIISCNGILGVFISGTANYNKVQGNYIGTDVTGTKIDADGNPGNGHEFGNGQDGIEIQNAAQNTIGGTTGVTVGGPCTGACNVIAGSGELGIQLFGSGASQNTVQGNYIGTDKTGTVGLGNNFDGIQVDGAPNNTIGGAAAAARNLLSGNGRRGILIIQGTATKVWGNYIGTDTTGTADLGNAWDGVRIHDSQQVAVGGTTVVDPDGPCTGDCNLISGNDDEGIEISGASSSGNTIAGNFIGSDALGIAHLPNESDGVLLTDASGTVVGGTSLQEGNLISGNKGDGVEVTGAAAAGNTIRLDTIHENDGLGINLVGGDNERPSGVTPNDNLTDADTGPNGLINFPVGVTYDYDGANTWISGIDRTEGHHTQIDLYAIAEVDASGFGEGRKYLGTVTPKSDGSFVYVWPGTLPYPFVSATATNAVGSTSEFSPVCRSAFGYNDPDLDSDGLCDNWETEGIDFDGDGDADLPLHQYPYYANPRQKDVFVEVDYMAAGGGTTHRPLDASLQAVVLAFYRAPVFNPSGVYGVNLHIVGGQGQLDEEVPFIDTIKFFERNPGPYDDFPDIKLGLDTEPCDGFFGSMSERLSENCENILGARRLAFRYGLFGHKTDGGYSGSAESVGDDFLVTLGGKSAADIAGEGGQLVTESGTFMHELGHTLGLCHGGPLPRGIFNCDAPGQHNMNHKPNYLSIMNWLFQTRFNVADRPLDYSRWAIPLAGFLLEPSLDESRGIKPIPSDLTNHWKHTTFIVHDTDEHTCVPLGDKVPVDKAIDWNTSGTIDIQYVSVGINDYDLDSSDGLSCVGGGSDMLLGAEDWDALRYAVRHSPYFAHGAPGAEAAMPDPTPEEIAYLAQHADFDGDGASNYDDNCGTMANPDQTDSDNDGIGDACALQSLTLSSSHVTGGAPVTGTVALMQAAPSGGAALDHLLSSHPRVVSVPDRVTIAAGTISRPFPVVTRPVSETTVVIISAHFGAHMLEAALTVEPTEADFDSDGDVDLADYGGFPGCLSGPALPVSPGCQGLNFAADGAIDLVDFAVFQLAFTGRASSAACCLPDGECLAVPAAAECAARGGAYQGDDTDCESTDCPVIEFTFPAFDALNVGQIPPGAGWFERNLTGGSVPRGTYLSYRVTTDWVAGAGDPYSNEANIFFLNGALSGFTVVHLNGTLADNSQENGNAITLVWTGDFAIPYSGGDPLWFVAAQAWEASRADWRNVTITMSTQPARNGAKPSRPRW